ncbi:MAG: hypothetical protein PHR99_06065 [Methanobacteriales archaeon]|nr:hypothetical protein [Methanobacteriales archaeon]
MRGIIYPARKKYKNRKDPTRLDRVAGTIVNPRWGRACKNTNMEILDYDYNRVLNFCL